MYPKFMRVFGVLMVVVMLLSACQAAAVPAAAEPAAKLADLVSATSGQKVIGLVQIDLSNPFHIGEVEGAKEAARRFGFTLKVGSGEGDVNKQIQAFENMINEKVDAIAVNFIDVKAFGPAMAKAKAANIPVVCLHSKTDGCATVLGFSERNTGKLAGEYSVKMLIAKNGAPKGKVANLQGLLGQGLNTDRTGGWEDEIKKYPDIEVVAKEPTSWDPKKAVEITENWLTAYPDLDLIYGNSDSLTVPAENAIEQAGRLWDGKPGKPGEKIILTSVDGDDFAMQLIKEGKMSSTILLGSQYAGFWKAWVPYQVAMGQKVEAETFINGTLVSSENVDAALKLVDDMKNNIKTFPFEKQLTEVVDTYMKK